MWCISTTVSQWIHSTLARYLHTPQAWHGPCHVHRLSTCLSTVMGMSRHNRSYQTFPLLSNGIRTARRSLCMLARCVPGVDPHPGIGSPCRPLRHGSHLADAPNKQKRAHLRPPTTYGMICYAREAIMYKMWYIPS